MKQTVKILSSLALALSLSHCASMVNQGEKKDRAGTRTVIGDTQFKRPTADCPNGGVFALFKEGNGGDVDVLARGVVSSAAIDGDTISIP